MKDRYISTFHDVVTNLYEEGLKNITSLNEEQRHVFYYQDFIYYYENGDSSGFLYNKSPTSINDNFYQPYISSWRYFGFDSLADMVDEYNKLYQQALTLFYSRKQQVDFKEIINEIGLNALQVKIDLLMRDIYSNNISVRIWINNNLDKLKVRE